jgi:hypothetical protein
MVRVLLQLKVNRLCLVVDGTAGFDPLADIRCIGFNSIGSSAAVG